LALSQELAVALNQTNWVVLTNLVVTQSPHWFVDANASPAPRRSQRAAVSVGRHDFRKPGQLNLPVAIHAKAIEAVAKSVRLIQSMAR